MSMKERREVVYANYRLALYSGQTEEIKDKLTTIYMRCNKAIYGQPIMQDTKNEWICKQIQVKTPQQLLAEAAVKVVHSVINTQAPPELFKMLIFPRKFRKTARISFNTAPRTKKCRRALI